MKSYYDNRRATVCSCKEKAFKENGKPKSYIKLKLEAKIHVYTEQKDTNIAMKRNEKQAES